MRLIVMLIACAGLSLGADVTGTWSGTLSAHGNEMPGYMVLTQTGRSVTGTAGADAGRQHRIEKGMAEADQITIEARPGPTMLKFVMKEQGDQLSGEVFEDEERIGTISLARVKE